MEISNMQDLHFVFDKYREMVEYLQQEAKERNNTQAKEILDAVWLRLHQGPVRTLVLGVSSAGKSTLINALARNIVVPEGKRTTSPIPVWVYSRNGDKVPRIRILKNTEDGCQEHKCKRYEYLRDYCYTSKQAGQGTDHGKYKDLVAATVNVDTPALTDSGVTLIDTPGIGVSDGDNARVNEILRQGCEALIITFRTLQEEEVKQYFRELLVGEDAPLRNLIEEDRVLLVLNCDPKTQCISPIITRKHVEATFNGWDCGDRLFKLIAWDARICTCGLYEYVEFLPDDACEEDSEQAEAAQKKEIERDKLAKPQKDLERLEQALQEVAEDICNNSNAVNRILSPIKENLIRAAELLKEDLAQKREEIQKTEFAAPEEMEIRYKDLCDKVDYIIALEIEIKSTLQPTFSDADKILWSIPLEPELLLVDKNESADRYFKENLAKDNGPGMLANLIESRLYVRKDRLYEQLEDPSQNKELTYWIAKYCDISDKLETINSGMDSDSSETLDWKLTDSAARVRQIPENAKKYGRVELNLYDCFAITSNEKHDLIQYLIKKQPILTNDTILNALRRVMLWSNFCRERLNLILGKAVEEGRKKYIYAYRQAIISESKKVYPDVRAVLLEICVSAGLQKKKLGEEIREYKNSLKQAELDKIDAKIKYLNTVMDHIRKDEYQ